MPEAVLITVGSYLIGAIPVAYVSGRLLRGIDIREYGSANVGASNVWQSVARWAVVPVGLLEIAQGMAGILIAKGLEQSVEIQVTAGLAAIVGHNWSPFLRLTGGRGVGHSIGFMLVLSPLALVAFTVISLLGVVWRSVPLAVGLALALTPLVALAVGHATAIVLGCAAMAVIILTKRVLTNRVALPQGLDWRDVLLNRLLFDRDLRDRDAWVHRPAPGEEQSLEKRSH
jgi:glycerol-3-phosphate acyltransferase PlsY